MSANISFSERYINEGREGKDIDLPLFDLGTIIDATNNFSVDSKLGEGGFGPVYKVQQFKHIHYWRHSKKSQLWFSIKQLNLRLRCCTR